MFVSELIEELKKRDPNELVMIRGKMNGNFGEGIEVRGGYDKRTEGCTCIVSKYVD